MIERHPLTKPLIPTKTEQWAADRFTINRNREQRDASVLAAGITTNITGSRADIIIYDDVEVPNSCSTVQKRQNLRERIGESNFILVPDGMQIFVGTPHSYFSIYADTPRAEINEKEIFLNAFKRLEVPILDNFGSSVWPEEFTMERIKELKSQSGPNKFASQMMLQPMNISEGRLNTDLLNFYDETIHYFESQKVLQFSLRGNNLISCSAWWDPSFGSAGGDASVLAIVFTDTLGNNYLHHIEYINIEDITNTDEATSQCRIVVELLKKFYVPSVTIETNGLGKFLPAILRRELGVQNIPCAVIEKTAYQAKYIRILEAFDAVMAARALHVHDSVKKTPFLTEMMEWQPDNKSALDDGLDAVAGALSSEPIRLKRSYANAYNNPFKGKAHTAKTDYDV